MMMLYASKVEEVLLDNFVLDAIFVEVVVLLNDALLEVRLALDLLSEDDLLEKILLEDDLTVGVLLEEVLTMGLLVDLIE